MQQKASAIRQLKRDAMTVPVSALCIDLRNARDPLVRLRVAQLELLGRNVQEALGAVRAGGLLERREDRRHRRRW